MQETTKKERNAPDTSTKWAATTIMHLRDRQLLSAPLGLGPHKANKGHCKYC